VIQRRLYIKLKSSGLVAQIQHLQKAERNSSVLGLLASAVTKHSPSSDRGTGKSCGTIHIAKECDEQSARIRI
jgi:hypothetical protein